MRTILRPNSQLTGKNTGNFNGAGQASCRKMLPDSALTGKQGFQRRIKTGNDQGRNRECGFPDTGCLLWIR